MPKSNPPRDHHYVPQLLLMRFVSSEGTLWIHDIEKGAIYPGRPETAGFVRDLYSRVGPDGKQDHKHVENLMAETIDGPGDAVIKRLLVQEDFGALESAWNDFLIFAAAQLLRTPAYFEFTHNLAKPIMQESLERMAKHSNEFREGVRRKGLAKGMSEERVLKLLDATGKGEFKVKPTKDFEISFSLALLPGIFEEFRNMSWQIATLDADDPDLVVGDQPILRIVPDGKNIGLRNPAINIILPLSTRVAAVGNWNRTMCYTTFIKGKAAEINQQTIIYAQRFVFASQRSDQIVEQAKQLHATAPKLHHRWVKIGERLVFIPEYR